MSDERKDPPSTPTFRAFRARGEQAASSRRWLMPVLSVLALLLAIAVLIVAVAG